MRKAGLKKSNGWKSKVAKKSTPKIHLNSIYVHNET